MKKLSSAFHSAWEAFEIGNFDEVRILQEKNRSDISILHLYFVSFYLEHSKLPEDFETSHLSEESAFQPLLKSIYFMKKFAFKEAFEFWKEFFEKNKNYLTSPIINYAVKLSIEAEEYSYALELVKLDSPNTTESFYAEPILHALYYLKKFPELLKHYQKNHSFISETSTHFFMVGMSLLHLKKYKEAEYFFKKCENSYPLPSFEELQKEMQDRIQKIKILETKSNLNTEELKELGFAYLFTNQYKKAEQILRLAKSRVA